MTEENTMSARPVPVPSLESAPFWEAAETGKLLLQRDSAGAWRFPPRGVAPDPMQDGGCPRWEPASGTGQIHAFSTVHVPSDVAFADRVPYTVALVDLDEGPRIMVSVAEEDAARLRIDAPVRVRFARVDGTLLPIATPAGA
jgi:uncharacterized OB-fold protein